MRYAAGADAAGAITGSKLTLTQLGASGWAPSCKVGSLHYLKMQNCQRPCNYSHTRRVAQRHPSYRTHLLTSCIFPWTQPDEATFLDLDLSFIYFYVLMKKLL